MNLENVQIELGRLLALVQGWISGGEIPAIERDLVLDKLKTLYGELRFVRPEMEEPATPAAEVHAVAAPAEEAVPDLPALDVIDLDEVFLSEELFAETPEVGPAAEEPAVLDPESEPVRVPEEPAAAGKEPERTVPEEPAAGPQKETAPRLQSSLFDLDEIPVHRRESRRALMSLYGEAPARKSNRHRPKHEPAPDSEPPVEEIRPAAAPVAEAGMPSPAEPMPAVENPGQPEPAAAAAPVAAFEPEPEPVATVSEALDEPVFSEEPVSEGLPVLGEVIGSERRTLADTIAPQRSTLGAAAGSIASIRSAIGINDRFLLIGELFGGDAALYEQAIDALDGMESLDDCLIYAAENYVWNANSDGAKLLFELLERKYGAC